ncbi:MAG: alpha/beta hydrolase [Pleomorphochaeta sp.]
MNYEKCVLNLRHQKINEETESYNMYVKYIPETKDKGAVDSRQARFSKKFLDNPPLNIKDKKNITLDELNQIRSGFGCENFDMSQNVEVFNTVFNNVNVEIYRKKDIANDNPVIINIHGGGFFGGTVDVVRNSCKLLADRSCSTVISIDYDLSPEAKYPKALNQCNSVIDYVVEHEKELKVDATKIVLMGDSAGGNLAAACCLSSKTTNIVLQVLLYPLIELKPSEPLWSEDLYDIGDNKDKEVKTFLINDIKKLNEVCIYTYINDEKELNDELVSPIKAKDYSLFPMTLIVSPEFDYLRYQAESFAKKLVENGIDTILYRYKGMGHAFYEHLGEFPQAEDCINEIAEAIMSL